MIYQMYNQCRFKAKYFNFDSFLYIKFENYVFSAFRCDLVAIANCKKEKVDVGISTGNLFEL